MSTIEDSYRLLATLADCRRYPFKDRLPLWYERLAANLGELEALRHAPSPPATPYQPVNLRKVDNIPYLGQSFDGIPDTVARCKFKQIKRLHTALERARNQAHLNAFISLADTEPQIHSEHGLLSGVTVAVKDMSKVYGFKLTGGSHALAGSVSENDATCVKRLREAGALIVGTTNLHELAYGITSENPHFGTVDNPILLGHTAGGSSGGSASAVAAGIVDCAIGTDTGGSVRIPAACCGVVGFKPSFGLIPMKDTLPVGWSLDHIGTFTRNVTDAAALTAVLANKPYERKPFTSFDERPLRIMVPRNHFFDYLEPPIRERMERVIRQLRMAGHELADCHLEMLDCSAGAQFVTLATEATENYYHLLIERPDALGPDVRVRLEVGQFLSAMDYHKAQRIRSHMRASWESAISGVDVILTPTLITEPPPHGTSRLQIGAQSFSIHAAQTHCTMPFNLTGMPTITLPIPESSGSWPLSIQLTAATGNDPALLAAARRIEALFTGSA